MPKVSESKKKIVKEIEDLAKKFKVVGIVNMEGLPAPQLQSMKSDLRGKLELYMTKKRLMKIALQNLKEAKKDIEKISEHFTGMPALIFTNENPFRLSMMLQKSKTSAPAKAGQTAPSDISVKKGPTPFAPGPVISELSSIGLKVGVENGKVAVKEDSIVAKKGEKIKPKVAEILTRLDIKPMEVGLGLIIAYEDGITYSKEILEVDETEFKNKIDLAAQQAYNLAFEISYPTKDNIDQLIAKAFNDAKIMGVTQNILDKGIIEELLSKAEIEMLSLSGTANISAEAPKQEAKKEEPKKGEKQEVPKEESKVEDKKPEPPKEEPKPEVQKEEPKKEEPKQEEAKIEEKPVQAPKIEQKSEQKKEDNNKNQANTEEKVKNMVENTKKFSKGKEETADDILNEVSKVKDQEDQNKKNQDEKKVPSAHDLKQKKEAKDNEPKKEVNDQSTEDKTKEVEDLTKELIRKGTLRK